MRTRRTLFKAVAGHFTLYPQPIFNCVGVDVKVHFIPIARRVDRKDKLSVRLLKTTKKSFIFFTFVTYNFL